MRRIGLTLLLLGAAFALAPQNLVILCENEPPNQMVGKDGKLSGYTIDLVREIQRRVGNSDPIQMVPWARGYQMIQEKPNVVLFQMTRTPQRDPLFRWVGPVFEEVFAFFARADNPVRLESLEDAKRAGPIGVYRNTERDLILTAAGFTNLDRADDPMQNIRKLMAGRLELVAASPESVPEIAKAAGYSAADLRLVLPFARSQTCIAMSRDMPAAVVDSWNAALLAMKRDGSFEGMFRKYYPDLELPGPTLAPF